MQNNQRVIILSHNSSPLAPSWHRRLFAHHVRPDRVNLLLHMILSPPIPLSVPFQCCDSFKIALYFAYDWPIVWICYRAWSVQHAFWGSYFGTSTTKEQWFCFKTATSNSPCWPFVRTWFYTFQKVAYCLTHFVTPKVRGNYFVSQLFIISSFLALLRLHMWRIISIDLQNSLMLAF